MGKVGVLDANVIFQRLLVWFLWPKIMRFLSLMIFIWYLVKMEIKSSSQIVSMEMREPVMRLYKMGPSWSV